MKERQVVDPTFGTAVRRHLENCFSGHRIERREFNQGPIQTVAPGFHVLAVSPGTNVGLWNYVSVGGWIVKKVNLPPTEFLIVSRDDRSKYVERLAMTVHYHHTHTLRLGDTFPLGEAWVGGSALDHALISRPYLYGPSFEQFSLDGAEHGHILWVLPITQAEREFKKKYGLEALEQRFEESAFVYSDFSRKSVV